MNNLSLNKFLKNLEKYSYEEQLDFFLNECELKDFNKIVFCRYYSKFSPNIKYYINRQFAILLQRSNRKLIKNIKDFNINIDDILDEMKEKELCDFKRKNIHNIEAYKFISNIALYILNKYKDEKTIYEYSIKHFCIDEEFYLFILNYYNTSFLKLKKKSSSKILINFLLNQKLELKEKQTIFFEIDKYNCYFKNKFNLLINFMINFNDELYKYDEIYDKYLKICLIRLNKIPLYEFNYINFSFLKEKDLNNIESIKFMKKLKGE